VRDLAAWRIPLKPLTLTLSRRERGQKVRSRLAMDGDTWTAHHVVLHHSLLGAMPRGARV